MLEGPNSDVRNLNMAFTSKNSYLKMRGRYAEVPADATIVLPLLIKGVLQKLKAIPHILPPLKTCPSSRISQSA